ncbi:MAG: hypothetical protein JWO82_3927 [Akkermansiaceae bacterium]|nr:hypothetical protein [Akkermansiaceae bacterium]
MVPGQSPRESGAGNAGGGKQDGLFGFHRLRVEGAKAGRLAMKLGDRQKRGVFFNQGAASSTTKALPEEASLALMTSSAVAPVSTAE